MPLNVSPETPDKSFHRKPYVPVGHHISHSSSPWPRSCHTCPLQQLYQIRNHEAGGLPVRDTHCHCFVPETQHCSTPLPAVCSRSAISASKTVSLLSMTGQPLYHSFCSSYSPQQQFLLWSTSPQGSRWAPGD